MFPRALRLSRHFSTHSVDQLKIASSSDGLTSSLTIGINAGPRYQKIPGTASVLKHSLFKSNARRSALGLIREVEFHGGVLSTSLTHEHLFLTAEFLKQDTDLFAGILADAVTTPKFKQHEFDEQAVKQAVEEQALAASNPEVYSIDKMLRLAYRAEGVGQPMFVNPDRPVTRADLVGLASLTFVQPNLVVVGTGVEASKLTQLVSTHLSNLPQASVPTQFAASKFYGGEHRVERPDGFFMIGFERSPVNAPDSLHYAVLKWLLGGQKHVKWGTGVSPLSRTGGQAFNLSFSDTGVFGFQVSGSGLLLKESVKRSVDCLKQVAEGISAESFQAAVAKAKFELASVRECNAHLLVASELLHTGTVSNLQDLFKSLDELKAETIRGVAEKMLKSKPVVVATEQAPYVDQVL